MIVIERRVSIDDKAIQCGNGIVVPLVSQKSEEQIPLLAQSMPVVDILMKEVVKEEEEIASD